METGSAVQNPNNIEKVLVQVISFEKMKEVMKNLGLKKDSSNFKEIFNKLEAHNLIRPEYLAMVLESAVKNPNTQITVYFNIWFGEKGKDVSEKLYNSHVNKIQEIFNKWLEKDLEGEVKNVSFKKVAELKGLDEGMGWKLSSAIKNLNDNNNQAIQMLELEAQHQDQLGRTHDAAEGIMSFLQKRKANYRGK